MPTTIPVRVPETRSDDGLVSFCLALLPFYVVLALVLLSIMGIEMHFGMYPSVTFSEALFGTLQSLLPAGASTPEMAGRDGPVASIGRWASRLAKAARRHERSYVGRKQSLAVRGQSEHRRLFRFRHSFARQVDRLQFLRMGQRTALV
jgi:hypothetical protein